MDGTRRVIGAGAAISNVAPGSVSLDRIDPLTSTTVRARAVENVLTNENWDYIVGTATCAFTTS